VTTDWSAQVLAEVDAVAEELVTWLSDFVRLPSIGGTTEENDAQHRLAAQLAELDLEVDLWPIPLSEISAEPDFPGVEVERAEAWGLVARLPGTGDGPALMVNGHVDVVPPGSLDSWGDGDPFSGRVAGDTMYGRGTCDMKGGLAAGLFAMKALRHSGIRLRGDVLLACVQGEEDGGLGTYAAIRRGWTADACVIPEPTDLDLVPANAGALTFRITVPGLATHAARRTAGVSALANLEPVLRSLERLEARRNANPDPLTARWNIPYPLSIGRVRCGEWASTVPDLLVAEGRLGVALDEPATDARADLEAAVAEACAGDPWLRDHPATVEWWGGAFESARLPEGSDLLDRVARAHQRVSDRRQEVWAAPYGSDLRLMTKLAGVPTVHYGPGDVTLAHGPDESVPLSEVITCTRALAMLAVDYCG
jgi:acetylornithine deacetylase